MIAAWELQKAIYARLSGDAAVKSLIGDPVRVFDIAPKTTVYPYVAFSDWKTQPLIASPGGEVHELRLHVYSRDEGRRETRAILAAIYDALQDADLALGTAELTSLRFVFSDLFQSADRRTWNGVLRFRAVTHALAPAA